MTKLIEAQLGSPITGNQSDYVEYLRTLVRGEYEANDRIEERLDEAGWVGYPQFIATAFFLAVDRHFKRSAHPGEIIRFVAGIRSQIPPDGPVINQELAERLIKSVLDENTAVNRESSDQEMIGKIQSLVVYHILADERDKIDLDEFLAETSALAARS